MKRLTIALSISMIGIADLPQALAADTQTAVLDPVLVTAQRREESAQNVGIAISVISGSELSARGIDNVNKLQNEVPSLEVESAFGSGQPQFRIRGIGFQDYGANNSSTVGVYVDEVSYAFPIQTQAFLFDLDRVEVLRGPQGTLYGKNTTGGAINFLTRKPTKQFDANISVGYASHDEKTLEGFVSGSFNDKLRGRISFAADQGGAWQHNRVTGEKLGDKDIVAVRGQLELDATPTFKLNLTANYGQDKSDVQGLYLFSARPHYGYSADGDNTATGWGLSPAFASLIGVPASSKPHKDNNTSDVSLTANWNLDAVKLTSITSGQHFSRKELGDWDGTSVNNADPYWKDDADIFTQELRIGSNKFSAFNWVAGIYYGKEKLKEDWYTDFTRDYGGITRTKYDQESKTTAIFGQGDYNFSQDWKLIAGLRQEHENRSVTNFTTFFAGSPTVAGQSSSLSTSNTSGKISLEYQASKNALVYGTISRGTKSGGITAHNTFNAFALTPFQPEKLTNFEVGFKADLTSSLRLNGAVFHYDYRDQQFQDVTTGPSGALIGKIINIAKSKVDGGELELLWKPVAGLTIGQSLGYKHAVFKDFNSPLLGNLSGHDEFIPKVSYGGSATYAWNSGGYGYKLEGDYSYRDTYHSWLNLLNPDGGTVYDIPSYWLANARLEVGPTSAPWHVNLWVHNLFDKKYDLTRNFFGNRPGGTADDLNVAAAGQPRTVGVQLSYAF